MMDRQHPGAVGLRQDRRIIGILYHMRPLDEEIVIGLIQGSKGSLVHIVLLLFRRTELRLIHTQSRRILFKIDPHLPDFRTADREDLHAPFKRFSLLIIQSVFEHAQHIRVIIEGVGELDHLVKVPLKSPASFFQLFPALLDLMLLDR